MAASLFEIPNYAGKHTLQRGNMAGKMPRKPEGTTANSANKAIKCKRTGNMEVNENETEPHENNDHAKVKQLRYSDRK